MPMGKFDEMYNRVTLSWGERGGGNIGAIVHFT